jgi:hypothetical protein
MNRLFKAAPLVCAAALALALTGARPAAAEIVPFVNGGFDSGDFAGWSVSGAGPAEITAFPTVVGQVSPAVTITNYPLIAGPATVSQAFSVPANGTVTLSADVAGRFGGLGGVMQFKILLRRAGDPADQQIGFQSLSVPAFQLPPLTPIKRGTVNATLPLTAGEYIASFYLDIVTFGAGSAYLDNARVAFTPFLEMASGQGLIAGGPAEFTVDVEGDAAAFALQSTIVHFHLSDPTPNASVAGGALGTHIDTTAPWTMSTFGPGRFGGSPQLRFEGLVKVNHQPGFYVYVSLADSSLFPAGSGRGDFISVLVYDAMTRQVVYSRSGDVTGPNAALSFPTAN